MSIKKFVAATARDALRRVRVEMGADAVILSNRKVDGGVEIMALSDADFAGLTQPVLPAVVPNVGLMNAGLIDYGSMNLGQKSVGRNHFSPRKVSEKSAAQDAVKTPLPLKIPVKEPAHAHIKMPVKEQAVASNFAAEPIPKHTLPIAAAMPAPPAASAEMGVASSALQAAQRGILGEMKVMRNMLQEQMAFMSWSNMQQHDPQRTHHMRCLLKVGFSPVLSRQLLEKMPSNVNVSWVKQVLKRNLRVATQEENVITRGGVVALIGPTGVGKTTTTAKLAARAVVRYGVDKVALLTTDGYRIGAHEQLRIYGKILGVAVHAVRDADDLRRTLAGLTHKHLVLIDTIGMGQRDPRVAAQTEMFNANAVQSLLLLNATSSGDTLNDVVKMYRCAGMIGCIPTKLDEAVNYGAVLDVAVRHKLRLHYIASGQRVPEDLHEINLDYLLHRTFKDIARSNPFELDEAEYPALMAGLGAAPTMRGSYAA